MKSVHKLRDHHTKRRNSYLIVKLIVVFVGALHLVTSPLNTARTSTSTTSLTLEVKKDTRSTLPPIGNHQLAIANARPVLTDSLSQNNETTISLCVPAILKDYETGDLQRLLASIHGQTKPPTEVIVIISGVSEEQCQTIQAATTTVSSLTTLTIKCRSALQRQSVSRNECAKHARGGVISFIDADDQMTPNKVQVVLELNELYHPKLILHGWTAVEQDAATNANASWHEYPIMHGKQLYQLAQQTKAKHLWLHEFLIHSMATISRNVTIQHREEEQYYREEDSWFVRDVIEHYGEHDETAIYIQMPLGIYLAREYKGTNSRK